MGLHQSGLRRDRGQEDREGGGETGGSRKHMLHSKCHEKVFTGVPSSCQQVPLEHRYSLSSELDAGIQH